MIGISKSFKSVAVATAVLLSTCAYGISSVDNDTDHAYAESQQEQQEYKIDNVEIGGGGGYVCGIVYNPTEEGLVYARTDMGGAYIRDKETEEWIPITDWVSHDEWNLLGIESIATDPVETNRVYLAAGTYTNSWTNMNGYILRSTNASLRRQR